MPTLPHPWIETRGPAPVAVEPGAVPPAVELAPRWLWRAQFAALVALRPFADLNRRKWGFNFQALLDEALDRQRLFIETQHYAGDPLREPPEQRTLALRCLWDPAAAALRLVLLVRLNAPTQAAAHQAALDYWQGLQATFPDDYTLLPALTQPAFYRLAGWDLLQRSQAPADFAEIQRLVRWVNTGEQSFCLLGAWRQSPVANEQVWRALAGLDRPALFDITLRPTILFDDEVVVLDDLAAATKALAGGPVPVFVRPYADFAAKLYARLLETLRRPYLVQVTLAVPGGVPEYLSRAAGFAYLHSAAREPAAPGFELGLPAPAEAPAWQDRLRWLDAPEAVPGEPLTRLRKLVDANEANVFFHLPYWPESGIPGMVFATTLPETL